MEDPLQMHNQLKGFSQITQVSSLSYPKTIRKLDQDLNALRKANVNIKMRFRSTLINALLRVIRSHFLEAIHRNNQILSKRSNRWESEN